MSQYRTVACVDAEPEVPSAKDHGSYEDESRSHDGPAFGDARIREGRAAEQK
jgi:hypothetical protein